MDETSATDRRSPRHRRRFDSIFKLLLQRVEWAHWWLDAFASLPDGLAEQLTAWPTEWVSEDLGQSRSDKLFLAGGRDGSFQGLVLLECQDRYLANMGMRLQLYAYAALDIAEANGVAAAAGSGFWVHATVFHVGDHPWPVGHGLLGTTALAGGDRVMVREAVRVVDIHNHPDLDTAAASPWECIIQLFRISHALRNSQVVDRTVQALSRIRPQVEGLDRLLPADRNLRRQATAALRELFAYDFRELGHELPQDVSLEEAAMMYDTIAEGIKATLEHAKAEGRTEGEATQLTNVVAHMFPDQTEAFRNFLASCDRDMWPEMSEVLTWAGTGAEFMDWLVNGQSDSS